MVDPTAKVDLVSIRWREFGAEFVQDKLVLVQEVDEKQSGLVNEKLRHSARRKLISLVSMRE